MKILSLRVAAALMLLALFATAPARAEWRRAESPNFIVYGTMSAARLRERVLLLEDFNRLMRTIISVSAPPAATKLHVYIVDSYDDLNSIHAVPAGVTGFYTATPDGIAALVNGRVEGSANEVLFHEYAHHFMMQYAPNAYPAWYIEGFAEYFMTVRFSPRRIDIGNISRGRVHSIVEGTWLPMDRVLFGDTAGLNREGMAQYYAQAWLIVHYFYSNPERQAALRRYLVAARAGDPRAALQTATGMNVEQFTQEIRRYIAPRAISYRQMERAGAEPPPAVAITALPRSADDLMLFEAALRIGIPEQNHQPYLLRIRTAAARHPDDVFARRVLAHAELLYGDAAAADRLLDSLLAATPGNAELMYLKGMRYLIAAERESETRDADARAARTWFTRAHRADPNHYQTLFRYAQSMRGERGYVSENTANVLLLAHQLAPQVATVTMAAAAMLMNRRQYAEAVVLLAPLAADPHHADLARAARRLMEQATARMRPRGPTAAPEPEPEPEQAADAPGQ